MAEESQFASRTENKRKYEDHHTPPHSSGPRRPTGFSAPINSQSPDSANANPPSYNNVAPPADEFQLAKQRAQEIAAHFVQKPLSQQMPHSQVGMNAPSAIPVSYGFQGSKKIEIPNGRVGVIIGKSGETIKNFQLQSGAKIQVTRDSDADPKSLTRMVELMGTPEQISKAEQLIKDVLAEAEAGGSGTVARRFTVQAGAEQFQMKVPNNKASKSYTPCLGPDLPVGLIIGKGGETIKNMQARSGARIQLIPLHLPPGDTSTERTVYIDGTPEQIESAKQLVNEVISENRVRNPQMGGGYPPQQGFRPSSWGPPGPPMQQPGYGYMQQPGAYPGQPPQGGNTSQPPYPGYPSQPATTGGFSSGWDQTPVQPNQQTMQGSTGYDYYGQQQPHGGHSTTTDNSGYSYGQAPASTYGQQQGSYGDSGYAQPPAGQQQGYTDVYGVYHPPAPQPGYGSQTAPQTAYDQQQQGYSSSAPTYGTGLNSSQEGAAPSYGAQGGPTQVPPAQQVPPPVQPPTATGYGSQQPNTTPPSYPPQGTGQPGYGLPPTSQPGYGSQPPPIGQTGYGTSQGQKLPPGQAVYGQTQPPTSTQAGNMQSAPMQPGYPHSVPPSSTQSGYGQQDSGHYRPPPSGFGSAPGYGQPPPYGAQPAAQPGYGYSQVPAYSSDSTVGGTVHGTSSYDATAVSQSGQQSGVAKASPQS
ncbi:K Homology domain [Macleaya cordata]|uniref:K Homology domain n=1 Tax=Macleaya cordata TaxID=56857 RepID=A0A200QMW8_MACCD|nr:K Homology domain [Macleaya cordata]